MTDITPLRRDAAQGVVLGLIGGTLVGAWFFVADLVAGLPLRTPSVLGQAVLYGDRLPDLSHVDLPAALLYAGFHFVTFIGLGILLTALARQAVVEPTVRYALFIVFIGFEIFVAGVLGMLSESTRDLFPTWQVLTANALAAAAMALRLWWRHFGPSSSGVFRRHRLEREGDNVKAEPTGRAI